MPTYLHAFLAAGFLCACSAPAVPLASGSDNPANPSARSTPFVRPSNVLEAAAMPETSNPASATDAPSPMAGMDMSGTMPGPVAGGNALSPMPGMRVRQATPAAQGTQAVGKINAIEAATRTINLTHQPIGALGWPSMTMDFKVAPQVDIGALKPGDAVAFTLGAPDADGNRQIERVEPR